VLVPVVVFIIGFVSLPVIMCLKYALL